MISSNLVLYFHMYNGILTILLLYCFDVAIVHNHYLNDFIFTS